jgi:hypothetical protein
MFDGTGLGPRPAPFIPSNVPDLLVYLYPNVRSGARFGPQKMDRTCAKRAPPP